MLLLLSVYKNSCTVFWKSNNTKVLCLTLPKFPVLHSDPYSFCV